jgi:tight adherence protein B
MLVIVATVFTAVFVIVFLVLFVGTAKSSREFNQTMARLDSISVASATAAPEEVIDIRSEDALSNIPWLNELMQSFNIFPALRKLLRQADVEWEIGTLLLISLCLWGGVGFAVYVRTGAWIFAFLTGAFLSVAPWMMVLHKRSKRFDEFEEKLPEALDLMVSAIRAGHGFTSALGTASKEIGEPIAGELRKCFDEQNFGIPLRTAMINLADRVPTSDVRLIVSAVLIQKESGGNLAEILEKVAHIIRERFRLRRQIRVHTAQGRLTGWILAVMPIILGLAFYVINPERMSILWERPLGIKLMWAAAGMEMIGALIIRSIIRVRV